LIAVDAFNQKLVKKITQVHGVETKGLSGIPNPYLFLHAFRESSSDRWRLSIWNQTHAETTLPKRAFARQLEKGRTLSDLTFPKDWKPIVGFVVSNIDRAG